MADLLASSGEDSDNDLTIKINESYAEHYNKFRQKEVFQKLKDKYGEDVAKTKLENAESDSDSETESSEDEDAKELTEEVERDFFRTLSMLKSKNPQIYDGKTTFFAAKKGEDDENEPKKKVKKEKAMTIADLERKVMLEKGGKFEEMDEFQPSTSSHKTYEQELEDIKKSFKSASQDSDDEDDDNTGGLLSKKQKTAAEIKREEKDYKKWLAGQKSDLPDEEAKKDLKPLRDFWNNDKLDENEKFLRDYILNKGFKDQEDNDDEEDEDDDEVDLQEDERTLAEQEEFEHKYNFRFEEPDQEFIKRFPRTIKDSMRREESSRKKKRQEVKERKEKEKEKRREEIKQLKSLKRKEIMDKLNKLKKIAGADDLGLNEEDLEEDFDPVKYDKRMNEIFENYNAINAEGEEMEKPEFSDLESELEEELEFENWDDWSGHPQDEEEGGGGGDDEDENEGDQPRSSRDQLAKDLLDVTGKKRTKKKSKFAEMVEKKKPIFDPNDKTFEQYIDEYYALDFEDLIGDLPCRFKYRKVQPNDFGLSVDEVLSAPDRELNAWCSLRKTCQYRSDAEEQKDVVVFKNKGKNFDLKKKVLPSIFAQDQEEILQSELDKRARKSKSRRKRKQTETGGEEPAEKLMKEDSTVEAEGKKKKKRRKKKKKIGQGEENTEIKESPMVEQRNGKSEEGEENAKNGTDGQKKKKKKKVNTNKNEQNGATTELKQKRKKTSKEGAMKKKKKIEVEAEYSMSGERLKAYGLNPKKLKKKLFNQKMKAQQA